MVHFFFVFHKFRNAMKQCTKERRWWAFKGRPNMKSMWFRIRVSLFTIRYSKLFFPTLSLAGGLKLVAEGWRSISRHGTVPLYYFGLFWSSARLWNASDSIILARLLISDFCLCYFFRSSTQGSRTILPSVSSFSYYLLVCIKSIFVMLFLCVSIFLKFPSYVRST